MTAAYEVPQRGRFGQKRGSLLTVEYAFTEPGGLRRTGSDTVQPDWDLPRNGTAPVRYTPGEDGRSRLSGRTNWIGIGFFIISLLVMGVFSYRLWREASEATKPTKRKRAR